MHRRHRRIQEPAKKVIKSSKKLLTSDRSCAIIVLSRREENTTMKKEVYTINIDYIFDTAHKGANYSFDGGQHWSNSGDATEIITKSVLGFEAVKDGNTSYDKGSDIEELRASVKSSRFTLVNKVLADSFEDTVNVYFATTHSTTWIYGVIIEGIITLYFMDEVEFKEFLYKFTSLNERKVIRAKHTSGKMIKWFEDKLR